jgi:hypothetical protein
VLFSKRQEEIGSRAGHSLEVLVHRWPAGIKSRDLHTRCSSFSGINVKAALCQSAIQIAEALGVSYTGDEWRAEGPRRTLCLTNPTS